MCPADISIEKLRKGWRSPIYSLFEPDVKIKYEGGRKYHFFVCAAKRCRHSGDEAGVRRYLDKQDKSSTSNLKTHAISCWGEEAVRLVLAGKEPTSRSGSIFSAFAHQGQHRVTVSHCLHSSMETRYVCFTAIIPRYRSCSCLGPTS